MRVKATVSVLGMYADEEHEVSCTPRVLLMIQHGQLIWLDEDDYEVMEDAEGE